MDTRQLPSSPSDLGPVGQPKKPWQQMAAEKRQAELSKIPKEWMLDPSVVAEAKSRRSLTSPPLIESLLDSESCRITAMDATELLQQMGLGNLTAVEVVTAFCRRAAIVHQLTQNLLEIGFHIAINRAKELDDYFQAHRKLIGPLHGIPLTLKDQFHIHGLETCMGYIGWIGTFEGERGTGKERKFESELIREFWQLGAVPMAKTTLVQSTWSPETSNNILGYLHSPWNQAFSAGGSSGGEGVMQALRGSVFGIGTDIGGSVSMPASYNGIFSLKPSTGRMSMKGAASPGSGQQIMPSTAGIMGVSVATLRLVLKSLLSTEPWLHDPYVVPLPWREAEEFDADGVMPGEQYRPALGFMENDGIVTPHPPVQRALGVVKTALTGLGYNVVRWEPPSNRESERIHGPIARGDGCVDVWSALQLSGEPEVPEISGLFEAHGPREPMTLPAYQDVVAHMRDYRNRYQEYWLSTAEKTGSGRPVDAFISPVTVSSGLLPDSFFYGEYTNSINVLDFPAVVIPVLRADESVDKVNPSFTPLSDIDKISMDAYDPGAYHGAPAAILIVGQRLREEKLLSLAQVVVNALESCGQSRA